MVARFTVLITAVVSQVPLGRGQFVVCPQYFNKLKKKEMSMAPTPPQIKAVCSQTRWCPLTSPSTELTRFLFHRPSGLFRFLRAFAHAVSLLDPPPWLFCVFFSFSPLGLGSSRVPSPLTLFVSLFISFSALITSLITRHLRSLSAGTSSVLSALRHRTAAEPWASLTSGAHTGLCSGSPARWGLFPSERPCLGTLPFLSPAPLLAGSKRNLR